MAAMTGGGLRVRPGEVSMAHLGVLFLDELPEFQRAVLDLAASTAGKRRGDRGPRQCACNLSARVQLIAAMNPCRCGHLGDPGLACSRAPRCGGLSSKVSGPLLDRIDLHVEVEAVRAIDLAQASVAESSAQVAARVHSARQRQTARLKGTMMRSNADLDGETLDRFATPDSDGMKLLIRAAEAMNLTARGYTHSSCCAHHCRSGGGGNRVARPCRRGAFLSPPTATGLGRD
jgi:magnesium chelatase family protein